MRKFLMIPALVLLMVLAAACETIGTQGDAGSAQRFLPNIAGYNTTESDSIITALTTAGFGTALSTGNVPAIAAIERADAMLQCLRETGSIAARIYTEASPASPVPQAGATVVVNETRVNQNLLACLSQGRDLGGLSAQSVSLEPCASSGEFVADNNNYVFIYVGVGDGICNLFATHFSNVLANNAD